MHSSNFSYYDAPARAVAWSPWFPAGELLTTAADRTVTIWYPKTMERIVIDPDHEVPVSCVAFSNNGLFASASGNVIKIRAANEAWDEITRIDSEASAVTALKFCCYHEITKCDRPLLAYGREDGTISVYDVNERRKVTFHNSEKRVNSLAWMSFPHTALVVAGDDGRIVELNFCDLNFQLQKTSCRQAAASLLDVPYQPKGSESGGEPMPSILKNDRTVGFIKDLRIDYVAIGASAISARKRTLEYSIAQGTLARGKSGSPIQTLSWISDNPFNFATGDENGVLTFWAVKLKHRSPVISWLSKSNVSVEMEPVVSVKAHSQSVTAIACPPIRYSGFGLDATRDLLVSASLDGTVKLWNISSIRESRSDYEQLRFTRCVGATARAEIGSFSYDISIEPEYLLKRTLSGLGTRRRLA